MAEHAQVSNYLLAAGTIVAALFVAVQAWYARSAYVEETETRFLEKKLDICFENFDQAAQLDAALRYAVADPMKMMADWPPKVAVEDAETLMAMQKDVVPKLNALEAGLTKASVLGPLDKYRAYLAQQVRGLSKRLLDVNPAALGTAGSESEAVLALLSDFLGAQYSVFTGCRLVAEGEA